MALDSEKLATVVVDAVDETLRGVLGDVASEALYVHLQGEYSLSKKDIFNKLAEFTAAIRIIFGKVSPTVERAIARRFYSKLGLAFIEISGQASLQEYVNDAFARARRPVSKAITFPDEMQKVVDFAKGLKPHDHVILFYSEPELKRQLLFAYLKTGLENGEAVAYIASQETPEHIKQAMKKTGIDVERFEKSGALYVIPFTEWYYLHGYFDMTRTKELWEDLHHKATAQGFKGLRVTGETHCFFEHGQLNELVAYERALHEHLDLAMAAVCAYDTNEVPTATLHDIIAAHGNSIVLGPELRFVS